MQKIIVLKVLFLKTIIFQICYFEGEEEYLKGCEKGK
ncbi:hypothetical protein MEC_00146 [Bartonella alsatica IBS 382]|uniref:Uncharacterized protein n=1 Tax=Bartonella alsatica IBS 382 TaxID=1094551 RepID=J1IWM0_9HYPH|nr:hypothetical protein MEC_00146 [Bartonella alsatica IBS 382]